MWQVFQNKGKLKLEEEKQQQEDLIKEQLKALKLDHELQYGKITQRGLIAKMKLDEENEKAKEKKAAATAKVNDTQEVKTPSQMIEEKKKLSYLQMARLGYQEVINAIIRPPRAKYKMGALGPSEFSFCGEEFIRKDCTLMTERGYNIECSHWLPVRRKSDQIPVVVYMHGNASCRGEALPQLSLLLSMGLSVFSFDFAGSGNSDGEYVSLGYYEREDLTCVVAHLRASPSVSKIAFWGRSMGAACALMFGGRDTEISCMILDSPFCDLVQLAEEMVEKGREQGMIVPGVMLSAALQMIQFTVQKNANFNIRDISPVRHAKDCKMPALFVAGKHDDFIKKHHSEIICEQYAGESSLLVVPGDHNDPRPKVMLDRAVTFLEECLEIPKNCALPVPPSMNLQVPPWYHGRVQEPWSPQSPKTTNEEDDDSLSSADSEVAVPSKENTGFDNDEMGMTKERQQEIQGSLFKMLGQEGEKEDEIELSG